MPTVLCFGDSNTWGAVPHETRRYTHQERWPALLKSALGQQYELIEEGQPGRTSVHNDPFQGNKNGQRYLKPCLESHLPDLVLILLGTNDLKRRFSLSSYDVAHGVSRIAEETLKFESEAMKNKPKVLLISPPPVYEVGYYANIFLGAREKSLTLATHYETFAKQLGCSFFDAGSVVKSCETEGIHWQADQHKRLAQALQPIVQNLLVE